jgi:hypothetical protein
MQRVVPLKVQTICKLGLLTGVVAILIGCSTEQKAAMAAQNRADVEAAVSAYDNQLVQSGEPYAVLSAQPRPIDDVAVFSPYQLLVIDGKKLERTPYSFTRARPLPRDLAFSELKVPVGTHDLTINGGAIRAYFTKFSNVKFEAGKRYVIVEEVAPDETITVHVSEYRQDKRFAPFDKEYYVIGKRISDAVERGGSTVVNLQGPKP